MKALIVSLESFQKGDVPEEVKKYIASNPVEPFIILDESSKIKTNNPCVDKKKSLRTQGIMKLNTVGERCILTGTFMSKSTVNAYDQMNFLKQGFFAETIFAFAERYTIRVTLASARGAKTTISEKTYKTVQRRLLKHKNNPEALEGAISGVRMYEGIDREDCLWILNHECKEGVPFKPFKNVDSLWERIGDNCMKIADDKNERTTKKKYNIKLTPTQRKLYLELQNLHCTDNITVDNGLQLYIRFQDICNGYEPIEVGEEVTSEGKIHKIVELKPLKENPKLDVFEEVVSEIGDEQILVWCSRTQLLNDARARLDKKGYTTGVYDGKVNLADRERDYKLFAQNKIQILFMNQRSGAFGLDRLQKANYAYYLCSSYSVEERVQSEGRTNRGVVEHDKFVIDAVCKGTCEDRVVSALAVGEELMSTGSVDANLFKLDESC